MTACVSTGIVIGAYATCGGLFAFVSWLLIRD